MIPEEFPVLTASDILINPDNYHVDEFDPNSPSTTSGWLKRLFLYGCYKIYDFNAVDAKDYSEAVTAFRKINGIPKRRGSDLSIEYWEDDPKNTKAKQAAALNKLRIKMGYTEEYYK